MTEGREKLAILGTSRFAPEVLDLVEDTGRFDVSCFVENRDRSRTAEGLLGLPVVWIEDAAPLAATHRALCRFGDRGGQTAQSPLRVTRSVR